ncbi:MAG: hypothetical protein RLZZ511_3233 [Cyanobacteriota bacterium]|jgi:predicted NACHT family NTPase
MASRSLTVVPSQLASIQQSLTAKKLSYEDFTKAADISRSTAINFCTGKKVDRKNFVTCCEKLELDWEVISGQKVEESAQSVEPSTDINLLVQQLRASSAESLRKRCGTMRILDMTTPIDSGAIYTDVNILERVAGKTRREIQDLMADCGAEQFDRFFLGGVKQKRVPGLEAVLDKKLLMILGRPGAGKTTFLKRLAIECLNGKFLGDRLPIFVTLKEFAETVNQPGLVNFMGIAKKQVPGILQAGKGLILLDGLDEVMEQDHDRVIREIRDFAEGYSQNHIVITCRIAAREYIFQQFTEVEMADFDDDQIQSFADKWFKTKEKNPESTTGEMFWQELESRKPVKELAANPLLLTLLCLEFDNSSAFPQSRSELYDRALNVLLAKWDGQRRILRGEEVYKGLSLKRKETLLGQLAMYTFERGDYFFKEKVATQQIEQYIRNLPGATEDPAALEVDSRAVLKSIESRHGLLSERATGIYSFSHLTFQEYFTAKNILDLSNPAAQEVALGKLIEHIGEKRWEEVFALVAEGLDSADYLLRLMKQRIDEILAGDQKLQLFLKWAHTKLESIQVTYKPAAVRAFYLIRAGILSSNFHLDITYDLPHAIDCDISSYSKCYRDDDIAFDLDIDASFNTANDIKSFFASDLDRYIITAFKIFPHLTLNFPRSEDPELKCRLQEIYDRLPKPDSSDQFQKWWNQHGDRWREDLRQIMIKYRNIGHDWQFTDEQETKLQEYYDANLLLANCLNSECYVSREVREEIEATMLLPVAEIERWKRENRREKMS